MVVGAVVAILILQPDVGMTAVVVLTFGFQMFLAGLPLLLILLALALAPLAGFLAYSFLGHVQVRVDKFLPAVICKQKGLSSPLWKVAGMGSDLAMVR